MNKIKNYVFVIMFIAVTFGLGALSFYKLAHFYVYKELDYNEWTPTLGRKFETDIASTFFQKISFVNLNGAVSSVLDQPTMNGVVKLNNGYLLTTLDKASDESLDKFTDSTVRFNEYLKNRGTSLVYASPPYTSGKYDPELPTGIEDYGNDNIDRLVARFNEAGIDTIDFRETMHEDGIDHYDMMFRTDHHWTTEAGLYAYGKLEDYICEKTGCTVDKRVSDINNYTVTRYEKWHLGSRGQRTGIYYAGIDDFDLITPNFETDLTDLISGQTGTMQDCMFDMSPLQNKNYTSRFTYDYVLGNAHGHFVNNLSQNDVKVLIITDSFGKAVFPYLAMGFRETQQAYDLELSKVTPELIEEYDPDVVIMLYYPDVINDESGSYNFEGF